LYKLLTSGLNSKKREDESFAVNQNDVQELVKVFGI
jgi:hypothetical protein